MADPAVAILLFQVAQSRNFIHDDLIPALSKELARRGVANQIFEATLPSIDAHDAGDTAALDALAAQVRGRFAVCAYARIWSDGIFQRLRALLPDVVWVHLGDPRMAFPGTTHALSSIQVPALEAIARAVADGRPVDASVFQLPTVELTRAHGADNLVRITVGQHAKPDRPAVVHGSAGCAFSLDVRENPRFADVKFPDAKVVYRGCSFCASGGVPRRPAGETLRSVLEQLDHILATEPETSRVQINDQNPFPYLVSFVERAGERATRPLEILIETRADWFLGAVPVMERALQAAERTGHRILLFLVGLENLSQRELELYNKGATVAQNEEAVRACRRLKSAYPKGYSTTKAAFGFILYNPWTELSDLVANADAVERIKLDEFRGQIARSKLRLYPDTALFYKAQQDGLIAERFPYDAMDSSRRYGYEAEVPWRFMHPATDRAYGVHDTVQRVLGKHDEMPMLREIARFLEANPLRVTEPVDDLARDLLRAMGPRRVQSLRHSG